MLLSSRHKKIFRLAFPLAIIIMSLYCSGSGENAAPAATGGGSGGGSSDSTAPTAGTAIIFSGISDTTITVSWGAGSDNVTSVANLQYRLVKATSSAAIDTVAEVDAISGADLIDDYTTNLLTKNVTGLAAGNTYFFAVVVKDAAGFKAIYTPASQATSATGTAVSPVFNPAPGTYIADQSLSITSSTSGAVICYTLNGDTPACNGGKTACVTGTLYPGSAITVSATATYKALACKSDIANVSSVTSGLYTIDKTAPTVASTSPANNATGVATNTTIAVTFSEAMKVSTIKAVTGTTSCTTNTPTILVSTATDNFTSTCVAMSSATPVSSSGDTVFTMTPSSALSNSEVYKIRVTTGAQDAAGNAIASEYTLADGFTVASAGTLTLNDPSPAPGSYTSAQSISYTTTVGGAKICYTTNGDTPAASTPGSCSTGTEISEGQNITVNTGTIRALATKVGYTNSAVKASVYTINPVVNSTSPANNTTGADPSGMITVTFSAGINSGTVTVNATNGACTGHIQISADNFVNCVGVSVGGGGNTVSLTPVTALASATVYKIKVTTGLNDTSANAIASFTQANGFTTRYYRTESIDGTNNFVAGETFATSSAGYTSYVTWDKDYVYVGYNGVDVNSGTSTKWVLLYIGSASGSSTGVTYNTQTPTFPTGFNAKYHLRWKADNLYTNTQTYTAAWADASWDFTGDVFKNTNFIEFRIPRADIGSPTAFKFTINMINEQGGGEWTYGLSPSAGLTDGYGANPTKYLSCDMASSSQPTTACSVLP